MNREQERAKRRPEKNPVVEYNKIQNKYYPELFAKFAEVNDPRNQSYIEYPVRVMLGTMYYKCISGISSMQEMTLKFNDDAVVENLYSFMSEEKKEYLPHGVIENEFLARLNPEELEKIQKDIAYSMIRRKTFDDARVLKRWQIIIDATELDEGYQKKNEYYLSRCYNRGEADEFTKYHRSVLEAKLYLGNNLVCSIASEAIQNSEEYINQSEKKIKQDCESKAFIRVAEKIKKQFPRLPIIITADGLYVSQKVIQTCTDNSWNYIIRYKKGSASSIAKESSAFACARPVCIMVSNFSFDNASLVVKVLGISNEKGTPFMYSSNFSIPSYNFKPQIIDFWTFSLNSYLITSAKVHEHSLYQVLNS